MVPCVGGMVSPSCDNGGNYATENESYLRILRKSSNNTWEITEKDGTLTILESVGDIASITGLTGDNADIGYDYRWLVTSVTDTHGNTVNYTYTCLELPTCYPELVTYNGTTIRFFREDRSVSRSSADWP